MTVAIRKKKKKKVWADLCLALELGGSSTMEPDVPTAYCIRLNIWQQHSLALHSVPEPLPAAAQPRP